MSVLKLCGAEERSLWAQAAVRALGRAIRQQPMLEAETHVAKATLDADALVREFRLRNGSQP